MPEPMELAYEERGSGPVLVFVHGFPFDRTMWIDQLAGLAKIRTAVAVDLRGHGLSDDEGKTAAGGFRLTPVDGQNKVTVAYECPAAAPKDLLRA